MNQKSVVQVIAINVDRERAEKEVEYLKETIEFLKEAFGVDQLLLDLSVFLANNFDQEEYETFFYDTDGSLNDLKVLQWYFGFQFGREYTMTELTNQD